MSERNRTFLIFCLGALLFAVALASPFPRNLQTGDRAILWMILFGMPYVLRELTRKVNWLAVVFLVLLVPGFYVAAWYAAILTWSRMTGPTLFPATEAFVPGLAGGFVGSSLSFLALFPLRLRADGASGVRMGLGIVLLTLLGGIGLAMPAATEGAWKLALCLFLPWQIVFGYFLSRLLKQSEPKRT